MKRILIVFMAFMFVGCAKRVHFNELPIKAQKVLTKHHDPNDLNNYDFQVDSVATKLFEFAKKQIGFFPKALTFKVPKKNVCKILLRDDVRDFSDCNIIGLLSHEACHCRQAEADWDFYWRYILPYGLGVLDKQRFIDIYQIHPLEKECYKVQSETMQTCANYDRDPYNFK